MTANTKRAEDAAQSYPEARIEASVDAIWQRPGEHDLVVVATPNASHAELASAAIEHGLAVVVDKPLAPSSEAARHLVEAAERRGVVLSVFQNRRWDSEQLTLRRLIGEGRLGDVRRYESRFERWRPKLRDEAWREATASREGGGVLLDLGTHLVDQAIALFGHVREVYGEIDRRRAGAADDDTFIAVRHESGVRSHLWASSVAAAAGPRVRVLGSAAAYVVEHLDGQEGALRDGSRPGGEEPWGVEPRERWGELVRGEEREPVRPENGAWPSYFGLLAAHLRGEGPPPVDPRDAVAVLEVLERARGNG